MKLTLDVLILFHLTTAAGEALYEGIVAATPAIIANIAVRIIAAALFLIARRSIRDKHRALVR